MSVAISGILLDPYGNPAPFAEVKFITWQGALDVLTTSSAVYKTSSDGVYSFAVEFGTFTVQVRYNQSNGKFETIKKKVIVNSETTASTLGELLLFNEPLTPPEIEYVKQLVAEAEGYRNETLTYRNETEAFRDEAGVSANEAEQSAIDAANSAAAVVGVPLNGGVWAAGQTYDFYNQYMIYNGTPLAPLASTPLPYGPVGATPDFNFVGPYPLNDHDRLSNLNPADGSAHNASDILDTDLGTQPLQTTITQLKLSRIRFNTLNGLVSGIDQGGFTVSIAALAAVKAVVSTNFNNIHANNSSFGGGANYQILTSADYGATPDGALLNGVYIGGDHYIGGGTAYVAKLLGNDSNQLDAEMFGSYQGQAVTDSTTAINKAFDYALGRTVYLPHKRLRYEGTWVGESMSVCGRKRPYWTPDLGSLAGGSILVGYCLWRPNNIVAVDFGFDHGVDSFPSTSADALKISAVSAGVGKVAIVHGCIGLGRQASDATHAILVEGYQHYEITDVVGIRTFFALAAKGAGGKIDGVKAIDNGLYSVIVKRDATYNTTNDNNISNIECIGTPSVTGIGLEIEVIDSQQMQRLNINNVNARNCGTPVRINCASGVINDLNLSNIIGQNTTDDALIITGTVFNAQLSNINMIACGERALNITGGRHFKISNMTATAKNGNTKFNTDFILVSATTSKTKMANVSLLQNGYETTGFGVIKYDNAPGQNEIIQYDASLIGTGVPV